MLTSAAPLPGRWQAPLSPLRRGVGLALCAFVLLASQDATIKLLAETLPLPSIFLVRSLGILACCLASGRRGLLPALVRSPVRGLLLLRAAVNLGAWSAYFVAAGSLPLGQLAAFQFLAPLLVVLAAGALLGEAGSTRQRLLVMLGTAGALISGGSLGIRLQPALLLAALAAILWACACILTRRIARTEGARVQVTATHLMFLVVMAPLALASGTMPAAADWPLLLLVALLCGAGHCALYSAARHVPASIMAPLEYTTLLWSFILGYIIWGNLPGPSILLGAGLIVLSCFGLLVRILRAGGEPADASRGSGKRLVVT